jgi:uncharacterized protein YecE (DUF72 family)
MKLYIGTSGYQYDFWIQNFYPKTIPKEEMLKYYARYYNSVEINYTFYKIPSLNTVLKWHRDTPRDFKFSIKVNQGITHYKKLNNVSKLLTKFLSSLKPLKSKLSCLLFQFPHNFSCTETNINRILAIKKYLPKRVNIAFEFRHNTWFNDRIYKLFNDQHWLLTLSYYPKILSTKYALKSSYVPKIEAYIYAKYLYIRMHGSKSEYGGSYTNTTLITIKNIIQNNNFQKVYAYFNNTDTLTNKIPSAILDANRFKKLLNQTIINKTKISTSDQYNQQYSKSNRENNKKQDTKTKIP